ncbi:cupin domain-containing protein [Bradyrhizobium barranii]|uniref:cupin domain-containing protein n=1 Tax=Bradyrhizobium TaxID=374 RepID=UPI003F24C9F6
MSQTTTSASHPDRNARADWLQTRPGELFLMRVSAADTNGVYSLVEIVSDPGDGTPLHVHQNEDEYLFVLEGTARFALGDKIFDAEAGTMVTLPKGIPHAWGNRSTSKLRIAGIAYPGGVEEAMRVIAKGGVTDLPALAKKFAIKVLGPTPF